MPEGKGLGFVPGPVDERDRPLGAALERFGVPRTRGSQFYFVPEPRLDQFREGACVGFSWTNSVNAAPKVHKYDNSYAQSIYYRARQLDEWPGEDYDGTSVRAGAKSCTEKGWIKSYAFTQDPREAALWVLNQRPVVIGISWMESMYSAKKENGYFIKPEGEVVGGHAICIDGVRYMEGGKGGDYIRLMNSWGDDFGYSGRCKMTFADFEKLLSDRYAVACTATEV